MRKSEVHNEVLTLLLSTVADTVDLKFLLVAFGNTNDHVVNECTGKSVQSTVILIVGRAGNENLAAFDLDRHPAVKGFGKSTFRSLNGDSMSIGLNFYACRYLDWLSAYS